MVMELALLLPLLDEIHGCTFANIDSETWSSKSIRCVCEGERAIIFRTKGGSGYENMVKRRLEEAGKDPSRFRVGPLPWGERVNDLPLIKHKDEHYLQFIQLEKGKRVYFIGNTDEMIDADDLPAFGVYPRFSGGQGLPPDEQVVFNTYNIANIKRIALMGQDLSSSNVLSKPERAILRLSYKKGG